jgi:DNA topoisomerase-6 subunit B
MDPNQASIPANSDIGTQRDTHKDFKEHSVAEFFKKNKHMLGFSGKTRSLTTIIHEYVTNSLDACDEHGILPNIKVEIIEIGEDKYRVVVSDNGPGMPKNIIGKALGKMLAGTKFHRYMQQRGQQGIGATGCTMYAQITTGQPIHVLSAHNGKMLSCDIRVNLKTNEPDMTIMGEQEASYHGLTIEAEFGDVKFDKSSYGVLEYLKKTAIANPHAQIELVAPGNEYYKFSRSIETVPKKPKEVKPHPLGISVYDLQAMAQSSKEPKLSGFLVGSFSRFSPQKVSELKEIIDVDFSKSPKELSWDESEKLVKAIQKLKWIAPPLDSVIPIGKEQIEKSMKNILDPEFINVVERDIKIYSGGIPFAVEVGIGFGGKINEQKGEIYRYANRTPLMFDASGCAIAAAIKEIEWKRYNIDMETDPAVIFVNISSVHIPYVGAGKQAISDIEEVQQEIKNAIMEAARGIRISLGRKRKVGDMEKKKTALLRYISRLSEDLANLAETGNKDDIQKKLTKIIEAKYMTGMVGDEEETKPESSGAGEGEENGGEKEE